MFIDRLFQDPISGLIQLAVVIFSICVHELSHTWVALKCGDDTAARAGHLTLNPMRQMGPVSLVMLLMVGIAWGAVPVNPYALTRKQRALVAAAGPLANLLLCVAFAGLTAVVLRMDVAPRGVFAACLLAASLNATLCIFNLLPIPGLDGWTVLASFFQELEAWLARFGAQAMWVLLAILIFTPVFQLVWSAGLRVTGLLIGFWSLLL